MSDLSVAIVSGGIGVIGAFGGIWLSALTSRSADTRRLAAEDARRWQGERRGAYARYLALTGKMLQQLDATAIFLRDGKTPLPEDDEEIVHDGFMRTTSDWEDELQPALGEVKLLANIQVIDLADRVADALMECTGPIEKRSAFSDFYPMWLATRDLIGLLLSEMRAELGLSAATRMGFPEEKDWPWVHESPLQGYIDRLSKQTYEHDHH